MDRQIGDAIKRLMDAREKLESDIHDAILARVEEFYIKTGMTPAAILVDIVDSGAVIVQDRRERLASRTVAGVRVGLLLQ